MAQVNNNNDIKYLTPIAVDTKRKKYCRFKKNRIKYIDYKDADFLLKFVNEQGKILPRRITGTSTKYQRKVAQAVKRARHLALMPFVADCLKRKILAEEMRQQAHKEQKIKDEAMEKAKALEGLKLQIPAKAAATGKIFGSVNTIMIANAIKEATKGCL